MNTFVERLKYAMEQADLKQSALSKLTGISKAAISQYLSGKNTPQLGADQGAGRCNRRDL